MMNKWKIHSKEDVSPSKWFPVERHQVELANGKIIDDFYISPMGEFVMILPITKENEIVFVKQYKHGAGEVLLELPAGYMEPSKTTKEMAIEELREETGILVKEADLKPIGRLINLPTKLQNATNAFLVCDVEITETQDLDENEEIEVVTIPTTETFEMIKNGNISSADTIAVLCKANLLYTELFNTQ